MLVTNNNAAHSTAPPLPVWPETMYAYRVGDGKLGRWFHFQTAAARKNPYFPLFRGCAGTTSNPCGRGASGRPGTMPDVDFLLRRRPHQPRQPRGEEWGEWFTPAAGSGGKGTSPPGQPNAGKTNKASVFCRPVAPNIYLFLPPERPLKDWKRRSTTPIIRAPGSSASTPR